MASESAPASYRNQRPGGPGWSARVSWCAWLSVRATLRLPRRSPPILGSCSFDSLEFEPPSAERHRHTLSNGVVVYVVEDHALPLVTVSVIGPDRELSRSGPDKGGSCQLHRQSDASGWRRRRYRPHDFDEEAAFLAAQIYELGWLYVWPGECELVEQGPRRRPWICSSAC